MQKVEFSWEKNLKYMSNNSDLSARFYRSFFFFEKSEPEMIEKFRSNEILSIWFIFLPVFLQAEQLTEEQIAGK